MLSLGATRRDLLAGLGSSLVLMAGASPADAGDVYVVSRERVLRQVKASQDLRRIEKQMTNRLQGQIDLAKARLNKEEQELTRRRADTDREDFDALAQNFDRRVRRTRALTQERAAAMQKGFQDARAKIVAALPNAEAEVAKAVGAQIIVSADHVIHADDSLDLTDRVIAAFDRLMPSAEPPEIDLDAPLLEDAASVGEDGAPAGKTSDPTEGETEQ